MLSRFTHHPTAALKRGLEPSPLPLQIQRRLAVLKFGSSALSGEQDLARIAGEIARQAIMFQQVIVVVSAFEGVTDSLLGEAASLAGDTDCGGTADLVSVGEEVAAAKLAIACSRIGLEPYIARAEQNGIIAEGPCQSARPVELEWPSHYASKRLIIVPGFVATDREGHRVLLGRGGSDFSAIFIAGELGARTVRLYKDVDGVYDHDPADAGSPAHRYLSISWSQCLEIARPLLQPAAIEYAKQRRLLIEVGTIGGADPTRVSESTKIDPAPRGNAHLKVGLAGFGVVGQALYQRLLGEPSIEVVAVLVRDPTKDRPLLPACGISADRDEFLSQDYDVLIDATCGEEIGRLLAEAQLARGGSVASANKVAIEPNLDRLLDLAKLAGGQLRYSACVGGGTPVLELVDRAREQGEIRSVRAVLNGTVNFLLDRLSRGEDFHAALRTARKAGFAEENPVQDLSGEDARIKLSLVARHAFGRDALVNPIQCVALDQSRQTEFAQSDERWIQLAMLNRGDGAVQGQIGFVPDTIIGGFPSLPAEWNYVRIDLADGRSVEAKGRGAGGPATAEAIVMDLYAIAASSQLVAHSVSE